MKIIEKSQRKHFMEFRNFFEVLTVIALAITYFALQYFYYNCNRICKTADNRKPLYLHDYNTILTSTFITVYTKTATRTTIWSKSDVLSTMRDLANVTLERKSVTLSDKSLV